MSVMLMGIPIERRHLEAGRDRLVTTVFAAWLVCEDRGDRGCNFLTGAGENHGASVFEGIASQCDDSRQTDDAARIGNYSEFPSRARGDASHFDKLHVDGKPAARHQPGSERARDLVV